MPKRIVPLSDMKIQKVNQKIKMSHYLMVAVYSLWSHLPVVSYGVLNTGLMEIAKGRDAETIRKHMKK